jgi:Zn-dependent M28 family amino/carboxypeptidase
MIKMNRKVVLGGVLALMGMAPAVGGQPAKIGPRKAADAGVLNPAREAITAERLLQQIKTLASDEFAGRQPGSRGEERTIQYLEQQFRALGLEPGNPDGTFIQKVPLVGITAERAMSLKLAPTGPQAVGPIDAKFGPDFVAWTKHVQDSVAVDAEMVFAGYGVQAPEFQWDDFKGLDVRGKVIVVLVNDPPVEDARVFGGKAMTYYGRWTYKYEKAAELGAAGCLIIHETGPAGYGWNVVQGRMAEQFDLSTPDKNMGRAAMEGWITWETAERLMRMAGQDLAALKRAAVRRDFRPVPLGVRASVTIRNQMRTVDSRNAIAKITGSDPKLRDQYVIYTAHWDHFGIGTPQNGDAIYNGAQDNASGTAAVLEIARGFQQLARAPRRSILFLLVTAEEQGLLGSQYYAEHPLYPLARTAAVINLDAMNLLGRTRDIVSVGLGNSTLDEALAAAAAEQGRVVKPDPEPEKGFFYRSDHFNFAKQGVPALDPGSGTEYIGKPADWGMKMRDEYTTKHYHRPSDDVKDYWDLSGLVEDAQLFLTVGYRVAETARLPEWKPGTEFKAKREAALKKR